MSSQFKVFLTALVAIAVAAGGYFYLQGAKKDTDTIVLGAAISLTGKYSTNGSHTKNGYDLAVLKINANGGVKVGDRSYKIKIIYYDDESTP
ncbi:MAG: ABC transporter substrate-binding protein, partial [Rhodospirillales bacterium]|nr:ABC transporter substrate-binding protein [Rhodospirillales bacterium]